MPFRFNFFNASSHNPDSNLRLTEEEQLQFLKKMSEGNPALEAEYNDLVESLKRIAEMEALGKQGDKLMTRYRRIIGEFSDVKSLRDAHLLAFYGEYSKAKSVLEKVHNYCLRDLKQYELKDKLPLRQSTFACRVIDVHKKIYSEMEDSFLKPEILFPPQLTSEKPPLLKKIEKWYYETLIAIGALVIPRNITKKDVNEALLLLKAYCDSVESSQTCKYYIEKYKDSFFVDKSVLQRCELSQKYKEGYKKIIHEVETEGYLQKPI